MGGCPGGTLPGLRRCRHPRQTGQTALCANMVCPTDGTKVESEAGVGTGCACRTCRHPGRHTPNPSQRGPTASGDGVSARHLGGKPIIVQICTISAGWTLFTQRHCGTPGLLPGRGKPWQPMFGAAPRALIPGCPCRIKPQRPPRGPPALKREAGPPDAQEP